MAKLQQFRDYHFEATQKVSENTRTLALSAIALVWMLKTGNNGHYIIPAQLVQPLLFVIGALALDFGQYLYRSIIWHLVFRNEECKLAKGKITEDDELYVSAWWNLISYAFFYTKAIFVAMAYWELWKYFSTITEIT